MFQAVREAMVPQNPRPSRYYSHGQYAWKYRRVGMEEYETELQDRGDFFLS